jgi:hypothetical protein
MRSTEMVPKERYMHETPSTNILRCEIIEVLQLEEEGKVSIK